MLLSENINKIPYIFTPQQFNKSHKRNFYSTYFSIKKIMVKLFNNILIESFLN